MMYSRSGFLRLCLFFLSLLASPLPALVVAILAYDRCERDTARPHPDSVRLLSPGSGERLPAKSEARRRRQATAAAAQTSPIEPLSPLNLCSARLCSLSEQNARTHALSARGVSRTPWAHHCTCTKKNSAPAPQLCYDTICIDKSD